MIFKKRVIFALVAMAMQLGGQTGTAAQLAPVAVPPAPPTFATSLVSRVTSKVPSANVVVSPLSLGEALALAGHAADGSTAREFDRALGLPVHARPALAAEALAKAAGTPADGVVIANAFWVPHAFSLDKDFDVKPFAGGVETLPDEQGAAVAKINAWVASATHGSIDALVQPPLDTSSFAVTNAAFFAGKWLHAFDPAKTVQHKFQGAEGKPTDVPMMMQDDQHALYWSSPELEAVRLPFAGSSLEYVVVMSRTRASADAIFHTIVDKSLYQDLCAGTGFAMREGVLGLPKHRVEFSVELKDALQDLGIKRAFAAGADFSSLTDTAQVLSSVRHRAVLVVDENGAKVAAATAVLAERSVAIEPLPKLDFVVDRPFVAFIVNREAPSWPLMISLVRAL